MNTTNRAEFEANGYKAAVLGDFIRNGDGTYALRVVQHRWEAWQAARADGRAELSDAEIDALLVKHGKGDDGFHAFARAILSAQADAPKRNKLPLSDEDKAAFHKAAECRDQAVELPSGALMFINYGEGPQDYSDLDCPHCGGSGHKGDITQPLIAEAARDDGPDLSSTPIPDGSTHGSALDQLYAAFHRAPCGNTLSAIGCAIQELQALEATQGDVAGDASIEERMAAQAKPFESYLTETDFHDLHRFMECCEDFDAGGHDVPKDRMRRLAELGVVRSCGFGRHEATAFGCYVHDGVWLQSPELPLRTIAERNERAAIAASKKDAP
ncbi:hypothetical protein [Herminiimonas sp. CN]|uniref:hypothetical protein n=1 Tax=Herminiimonas sp. CN TaxID=1349818 RepID=UPI000474217C|nr:hypothetical protein [Herminiimonas sp. CN]